MRSARHICERMGSFVIECDHWSECNVTSGGCCAAGHYGGRPSLGVCGQCPHRVVRGEQPIGTTVTHGATTTKAVQYLKTEAMHALKGPAPADVVETRSALCRSCEFRVDSLDDNTDPGGIGFCTKCGCGGNRRAALSVKLTLAGTSCPVGKFKASDGTKGSIESMMQALKGVAMTLADQAKKV